MQLTPCPLTQALLRDLVAVMQHEKGQTRDDAMIALYQKYCSSARPTNHVSQDIQSELHRQRIHLERKASSLQQRLEAEQHRGTKNVAKMRNDNVTLLEENAELRKNNKVRMS